ncbi:MAG: preprotein translocase subunit YajC [Candidatus Muproteobacteria bacterium RIFCSPHIGHO2_01_FULL_65_16]|uniref:Sec translocon accessory complex subunit YajC n=1 Tax=Candidatus Muproteobacteria bacterium RIFCSPHIGHO2_01_FULL_65_16 TaxID=1817764 RepID=A0A1F6TPG9_9PROT|nr:MAG: preprotein translocase subunit YajC [Candidatus Muproteobacteria bacterium RIFCSPHIGHO2_01_FULL_65_16]
MNHFISEVRAETPAPAPGNAPPPGFGAFGQFGQLLPIVLLFVVIYFLMIRPQTKRAKEHKAMVAALAKGDEVVTTGGALGKITGLGDSFVTLEVAQGVEIKIQRQAIQQVLPKGTIKSVASS